MEAVRVTVVEVVVGRREVRVERIEVAGLLHAVADAGKLIGEVLTAGVGGVEVALDDQSQATANDAVAVCVAQHARGEPGRCGLATAGSVQAKAYACGAAKSACARRPRMEPSA